MMNTQQATQRFARTVLAGLAALALAGAAQADIAVIVHPSNATALDDEQISKIFLGQTKTFSGGGEAVPVDQKEGATREDFGNKVLKKNPSQLKALCGRARSSQAVPSRRAR